MFVTQEKYSHNGCSLISFWGCQGAPMLVSELPKLFQNPQWDIDALTHPAARGLMPSPQRGPSCSSAALCRKLENIQVRSMGTPCSSREHTLWLQGHTSAPGGAYFSPRGTPCSSRRHTLQLQGAQWTVHTIQVSKAHPATRGAHPSTPGTSFSSKSAPFGSKNPILQQCSST